MAENFVQINTPIFITEGVTFQDQLNDIRSVISTNFPDVKFQKTLSPSAQDPTESLPAMKEIIDECGVIFNLTDRQKLDILFYNLISCFFYVPDQGKMDYFTSLSQVFKKDSHKNPALRLELLEMFFSCLMEHETAKATLLTTYLDICNTNNYFERINWITLSSLKLWSSAWDLQNERTKLEMFDMAKIAFNGAGRSQDAIDVIVEILSTFPTGSLSTLAQELICTILNKEDIYYFDKYSYLPPIQEPKIFNNKTLHELFQLMLYKSYAEFKIFAEKNRDFFKESSLNESLLEQKIRLLTIADYGSKKQNVTFSQIANLIDIPEDQVEYTILYAVKHKLFRVRINQCKAIVRFLDVPPRVFKVEQWKELQTKFEQFRANLSSLQANLPLV